MKKVCIVEDDIKLTNEEKEQLMEMRKEREREEAEKNQVLSESMNQLTLDSPSKSPSKRTKKGKK